MCGARKCLTWGVWWVHGVAVTANSLQTKREAAEVLGVHPSYIHHFINSGDLVVAQTIGGTAKRSGMLMFRRRDVARLKKQRERRAS